MFDSAKISFRDKREEKPQTLLCCPIQHLAGNLWIIQNEMGEGMGLGFYSSLADIQNRYSSHVCTEGKFKTLPQNFIVYGTSFQIKVWKALMKIPQGSTANYAAIARDIGHPKAVRAVGAAVGANRLCPLIPCQRVLPKQGGVGGFAFGKEIKTSLLKAEGIMMNKIGGFSK